MPHSFEQKRRRGVNLTAQSRRNEMLQCKYMVFSRLTSCNHTHTRVTYACNKVQFAVWMYALWMNFAAYIYENIFFSPINWSSGTLTCITLMDPAAFEESQRFSQRFASIRECLCVVSFLNESAFCLTQKVLLDIHMQRPWGIHLSISQRTQYLGQQNWVIRPAPVHFCVKTVCMISLQTTIPKFTMLDKLFPPVSEPDIRVYLFLDA